MSRFTKNTLVLSCLLAVIAIVLGAFGAHFLQEHLSGNELETFETGVRYHFYHVFALLFTAILSFLRPATNWTWPVLLFSMGILMFSGSIYLLATKNLHGLPTAILGPVTPLGGTVLIIGWIVLALHIVQIRNVKEN